MKTDRRVGRERRAAKGRGSDSTCWAPVLTHGAKPAPTIYIFKKEKCIHLNRLWCFAILSNLVRVFCAKDWSFTLNKLTNTIMVKKIKDATDAHLYTTLNITTVKPECKPPGQGHLHNHSGTGHHRSACAMSIFTKQMNFAGLLNDLEKKPDVVYVDRRVGSRFSSSKLTYQISRENKSLGVCLNHYSISHSNRAWKLHLNENIKIFPYLWSHLYCM